MRSQAELGNEDKVLGGTGILPVRCTGWKPVPPKEVGEDARHTNLFMLYRWVNGP